MAVIAGAQSRQVTNADLEKYRAERERSEQQYREIYAKRGFPSPEELARRRQQNELDNQELVLEIRERAIALEQFQLRNRQTNYYTTVQVENGSQNQQYPYSWTYSRPYRYPVRTKYGEPGYFAGGQFWPAPVRTPQQKPVWIWPR